MIKRFQEHFFSLTFKNVAFFTFLWLFIGFAVGTSILLGPVQEIATFFRQNGWDKSFQDFTVIAIIVVYVILTFIASLYLTRISARSKHIHVPAGIILAAFLTAASALYLWLNPNLLTGNNKATVSSNPQFTFGPYPTEERLSQLEKQGFTAVVSLLHPAVVPFEPKLINEQKELMQQTDLKYIHIPVLPWVSDNKSALDSLRTLAQTGQGKYYVHCYLGKDRVSTAQRVIENGSGSADIRRNNKSAARDKLPDETEMTRGPITKLADSVYVTPYPTDSEFVAHIFGWDVSNVISLMDPDNPDDLPWIEEERKLLSENLISFSNRPVSSSDYNSQRILEIARDVKAMPKPVMVHGFLTPSTSTQAFIQAYRSDLPPLAPRLFPLSMENGQATLIAPNAAVGPPPVGREFGGFLVPKGINEFVYLGQADDSTAVQDATVTGNYDINWRAYSVNENDIAGLIDTLQQNGPWYLYGPELQTVRDTLASSLGLAIPDTMTVEPMIADTEQESFNITGSIKTFFDKAIPGFNLVILLTPVLLLYIFFSAYYSGYLRTQKEVAPPYTRKIFHIFIFMMAALLQFFIGLPAVVIFGTLTSLAVLYAIYRGEGFPYYEAMARLTDRPHRSLFILIPLATTALGGVVANIFFIEFAYIGYLVTGLGDAIGEPVGKRWGNHRYKVPSLAGVAAERSLEGSAAVFGVSVVVSFLGLWLGGFAFVTALWVAALCGTAAALVESVSNHGIDNFTIQVAASGVVFLLLGS